MATHKESEEDILVTGVRKGLRPQFGFAIGEREGGNTFTEELVQQGLLPRSCKPPQNTASHSFLRGSGSQSQWQQPEAYQAPANDKSAYSQCQSKRGSAMVNQSAAQGPNQNHLHGLLLPQH